MEYMKYEYKSPSYKLINRENTKYIDFQEHCNKRRFFYSKEYGCFKSKAPEKDEITLLFAGDLLCQERMLESYERKEGGYDFSLCFEYIKPLLETVDFSAANLETAISHTAPYRGEILSHDGPYYCNAPIEYMEALSNASFDMLTTENNHTLDAGVRGVAETIENSSRFGFIQTGTFLKETEKYIIADVCGFKVGFTAFGGVPYNTMQQNLTEEGKEVILNTYSFDSAEKIYKEMKDKGAEYVICFPHWGKEFTDVLTIKQTDIAKDLTRIGYDLVVGAHSHVIQKFRMVNGKPVIFSLGSLISHLNIIGRKDAEYTVLCYLTLKRDGENILSSVEFIPCKVMKNYKGIPYTVVPVVEGLGLSEKNEPVLKNTAEKALKRLGCKPSRINVEFPVEYEKFSLMRHAEEQYEEKLEALVKNIKTTPTPEKIEIPAKRLWDTFKKYHEHKNCLYKIYSTYAELVQMEKTAEVIQLTTKVEEVPVKAIYGTGKQNTTARLIYLGKQVETIGEGAFKDYVNLESVRMFNHLKVISSNAFENCVTMTGVSLPLSLTEVGDEAFANCRSLLSAKIPPNVKRIGENVFAGCPELTIYCQQGTVAEKYAKKHNIPIKYMPIDPDYIYMVDTDTTDALGQNDAANVGTVEKCVMEGTVMGPMNGPDDKHPATIIATCYFVGKPLPATAKCANQPSYYIGEKAFDGKFDTIKRLLGDKMIDAPLEDQEKAFKLFRNKYKKQHNLPFSATDFVVYFCDWVLYARDRGFSISDYFEYELFKKEPEIRDTFLNEGYRQKVYEVCNKVGFRKVYLDKGLFNAKFKKYVNRDWVDASTCSFEEFKEFADKHDKFFAKPIRGTGGKGARVIEKSEGTLEELFDIAKEEGLILEEIIKQHESLAKINESTLNTVRINTLVCADGVARVMLAVGRYGRAGNVADNFHSGGVTALIDVETGIVMTEAIDITQMKTPIHPDSKEKIYGFKYPEWEKVKKAVCDAALLTPNVKHVGWDVAITEAGEVEFVEGNSRPNFDVLQVPDQTGRRHCYDKYFPEIARNEGKEFEKPEPLVVDITNMEAK